MDEYVYYLQRENLQGKNKLLDMNPYIFNFSELANKIELHLNKTNVVAEGTFCPDNIESEKTLIDLGDIIQKETRAEITHFLFRDGMIIEWQKMHREKIIFINIYLYLPINLFCMLNQYSTEKEYIKHTIIMTLKDQYKTSLNKLLRYINVFSLFSDKFYDYDVLLLKILTKSETIDLKWILLSCDLTFYLNRINTYKLIIVYESDREKYSHYESKCELKTKSKFIPYFINEQDQIVFIVLQTLFVTRDSLKYLMKNELITSIKTIYICTEPDDRKSNQLNIKYQEILQLFKFKYPYLENTLIIYSVKNIHNSLMVLKSAGYERGVLLISNLYRLKEPEEHNSDVLLKFDEIQIRENVVTDADFGFILHISAENADILFIRCDLRQLRNNQSANISVNRIKFEACLHDLPQEKIVEWIRKKLKVNVVQFE